MAMTGQRPLEDIEMLPLGEFIYTQVDIDTFCELPTIADKNPFHRRGKAPLNLSLGTITGRLSQWGIQQGMKVAAITEQYCQVRQPVQKECTYKLCAGAEHLDDGLANILFEVYDASEPLNPQTLVMSGYIQVRHS